MLRPYIMRYYFDTSHSYCTNTMPNPSNPFFPLDLSGNPSERSNIISPFLDPLPSFRKENF